MDPQSAYIVIGTGWGSVAPIVLRVCAGAAEAGDAVMLTEIPLGLDWSGSRGQAPAWTALARRADIALAELGLVRTVDWQPHVYPQPLAAATVSRLAPAAASA